MQGFILAIEESPQQRQRSWHALDQVGVGAGPDFRVLGGHAIGPATHRGWGRGKIRTLGLALLRNGRRGFDDCWYLQTTEQCEDDRLSHGPGETR